MLFKNVFKESAYYKTIEALSPDERTLCVMKQHPFGILVVYVSSFLAFILGLAIISFFLPSVFSSSGTVYALWSFFALVAGVLLLVMLGFSTYVYNQSVLTVTDKNVVQILQKSIYERKVSHISLANIEDVTSEQQGIFANWFNFGTIKIETAGEQANFTFPLCPHPNRIARIILDAKDDFLRSTGLTGSYRNSPRTTRIEHKDTVAIN